MKGELIYDFFSDDDFLRFSGKIKGMEKITAGEIRLSIKEGKRFFEKNRNIKDLAIREFYKLKMDKTRDHTGILIFLLLKEKQFFILADSGINEKVGQGTWDGVKDKMKELFENGKFSDGILYGIEKVGLLLGEHFPVKPDDTNELSNKVVL